MATDKNRQEPVLEHFKVFEHFTKAMLDGFVVVNRDGKVVKSNPLIPHMCGLTSKQILSLNSFDDVFTLKVGQRKLSIKEILDNGNPTRIDEVASIGRNGKELNLIIGYYPFVEGDKVVGAWLLLRDVTAETELQGKYKDKAEKSITDPMTGLFNRGHFDEYLKNQDATLIQLPVDSDHRNLSFIMVDIDHFKKVNDKYGHPAGDFIIKTVSGLMQRAFRKTDVLCRYGGEEFLVILPASNLEGAAIAAEKLRMAVENYQFVFQGTTIPVTISAGVAQLNVGLEKGTDSLSRADAALYGSKQGGRNRVSLHNGTIVESSTHKPMAVGQLASLPEAS
jgi:diguanylate cyclase (GGDEF)-like protein/PAS domain S-box-containing protein